MKRLAVAQLVILILALASLGQDRVAEFDRYAEAARKTWRVPGMAVTVVKDGKTILAKGYGVTEEGNGRAVDSKTLFGMMSTTKALTAVGLGMLVDEGKLAWDDKVVDHLPEFRLADPYVTRDLRIRDLLTHNSGIGNTDFLWGLDPDISAEEITRRMQFAGMSYPLRGGYTYQNLMYFFAGQVIERVSGKSWEEFTIERIFKPLGMNDSYPTYGKSKSYANRSVPHFLIDGEVTAISEMLADPIAPAGSAWSTADDVAKWVRFMLENPEIDGKRLLKPETHAEMLKPQVIVPASQFYPTAAVTNPNWITYGLAWFQHDYRGEKINFHTGSLAGRTAIVGILPSKGVGVYVFGNLDHAEVRHALMYKAFDLFGFGDEGRDWSAEFKTLYDGLEKQGEQQREKARSARAANTKPSHELGAYAGTYSDPFFGSVEVTLENGSLRMKAGAVSYATLNHWHYDTFEMVWDRKWFGSSIVSFGLDAVTGKVDRLNLGGRDLRREK